jgi:glucan 1,3-beta-glucosidase
MVPSLCALALLAAALAAPVVYRDVKQYGAKGDGVTDDTAAIIRALTEGRADDPGAVYPNAVYSPSTLRPAYVYFPEGVYVVRQTLPVVYNTQMVGNFSALPTIKFLGANTRVLESLSTAWYHDASVNNFYKRISNFIIDMTSCTACTGIHWQVAQGAERGGVFFVVAVGRFNAGTWEPCS